MKQKGNKQNLDPKKRETLIEGASAGPGESEFNYPTLGITVVAKTSEDADRKVREIIRNRGISDKEINKSNLENK